MERLTHIDHAGWYVDDQSIAFDERRRGKDVDRLAAYENTGLEPEEVTTEPYGCVFYCNRKCNLDGDFCSEGPGCPDEIGTETAKHLLELAKAEKDGRLVVLPCKPGQMVWAESPIRGRAYNFKAPDITWIIENTERFGREIFLTCEEAEAALKKREEGTP